MKKTNFAIRCKQCNTIGQQSNINHDVCIACETKTMYYRSYKHIGKNMKAALLFARLYAGWHSFDTTARHTVGPVMRLVKRGFIEVNKFGQFRAIPLQSADVN